MGFETQKLVPRFVNFFKTRPSVNFLSNGLTVLLPHHHLDRSLDDVEKTRGSFLNPDHQLPHQPHFFFLPPLPTVHFFPVCLLNHMVRFDSAPPKLERTISSPPFKHRWPLRIRTEKVKTKVKFIFCHQTVLALSEKPIAITTAILSCVFS